MLKSDKFIIDYLRDMEKAIAELNKNVKTLTAIAKKIDLPDADDSKAPQETKKGGRKPKVEYRNAGTPPEGVPEHGVAETAE